MAKHPPSHGASGYGNYGCRCRECKDGWAAAIHAYRERRKARTGERILNGKFLKRARADAGHGPSCWTPVPCPSCGSDLPPRGRTMPAEMGITGCCDEARMDSRVNPRHLWSEEEASDG